MRQDIQVLTQLAKISSICRAVQFSRVLLLLNDQCLSILSIKACLRHVLEDKDWEDKDKGV